MTTLNRFAVALGAGRTISPFVAIHSPRAASTVQTPYAGSGGQRTPPRKVDATGMGAGLGKGARPGTKTNTAAQAVPGSRWAHFAGMTTPAPIAAAPVITDITPADAAAFVMASAAKARGQKPAAAAKPSAAMKADMSTPDGIAAFVAASAAKCRAPSR